jgi:hypothetical protein
VAGVPGPIRLDRTGAVSVSSVPAAPVHEEHRQRAGEEEDEEEKGSGIHEELLP